MNDINRHNYLTVGKDYHFPHYSLLITETKGNACHLFIETKYDTGQCLLERHQQGVLVIAPAKIRVEQGGLRYVSRKFEKLAKLQVFVDKAQHKKREVCNQPGWGYLSSSLGLYPTTRDIEYWLLYQSIKDQPGYEQFIGVLRNNEWYTLVDFLFNEMRDDGNQHLQVLCSRYGLSVSHFRRLSRHALGNSTKSELRDWRLVRALLELVNSKNNFTTIAMNHGYASLSHFSNEVKSVLGVSPRDLKKLLHAS